MNESIKCPNPECYAENPANTKFLPINDTYNVIVIFHNYPC